MFPLSHFVLCQRTIASAWMTFANTKLPLATGTEQSLTHKDDQASKGILAFKKARKNKYISDFGNIWSIYNKNI